MRKQRGPLIHRLTSVSKEVLEEHIKKAMDESGITKQEEAIYQKEEEIKRLLEDKDKSDKEKRDLEKRFARLEKENVELEAAKKRVTEDVEHAQFSDGLLESGPITAMVLAKSGIGSGTRSGGTRSGGTRSGGTRSGGTRSGGTRSGGTSSDGGTSSNGGFFSFFGGCYPGSAIIYDSNSRARPIESLQVGDKVLTITKNGIKSDTVITFIHRQPEIVEEFLKIVTKKKKILPITADHLLFVELMGQATAIPARDVKIGDTVYVRGSHGSEKDLVQSISTVYEKGAYAPVTLSGTILVNDVHTSCYFDVLSHEWSHKAMSIARALHHVSPSMMRRISAIGEKDGFPGWCRLAHTMLTLPD